MLNQSLKIEFTHEYTTVEKTRYICSQTFKNAGEIEERYGVDLYAMSVEQLREVIIAVSGVRERSQYQKIAIIREYCRWCCRHNIAGATNNADSINVAGSDKIRRKYVSGPIELQKFLDEVFDPVEWDTVDNIYRCYLWLLFSGVWSEDVTTILKKDIDFSSMTINYRRMGQELEIYRGAIPAMKKCVYLDRIARVPDANPEFREYLTRQENDSLLVGPYVVPQNKTLNQAVWRHTAEKAKEEKERGAEFRYDVTPQKVFLSGMFYRAYEQERAGNGDGMRALAENRLMNVRLNGGYPSEIKGEANERYTDDWRIVTLTRDYRKDYINWKVAFNL